MLLTQFTEEKKLKIGFHIYPAVFFFFILIFLVWSEGKCSSVEKVNFYHREQC